MTEKRYSHDAIVIIDHLKKDLIYIDGKDELLELAEYVDRLQEENEQLKSDLGYWRTLAQSLAKGNNIGKFEMMDKEVTIDLNELDINIQKEIIFKSDLNKWIEKKMDYYEGIIEKTDGCNNVDAKGHLDMLIMLKEWIKQR